MKLGTLLLLTTVAFPLFASNTQEESKPTGRPNGEYWRSLSAAERRQFVEGMFTGLSMAVSYGDLSTETWRKLMLRRTFDEIVASFDEFFEEAANRKVWIESAWMIEAARGADVPPEEVNRLIDQLRAAVAGEVIAPREPPPTKYPELYDIAVNHAERSKEIEKTLGEDWDVSNQRANAWALGPDEGQAYVFMDIAGSKRSGRLSGRAKRVRGKWAYDDLEVLVVGTGDVIDLLQDIVR